MEISHKLAIIIPAFKAEFFHQTLQSIALQTCKKFTLYIGDDASPNNLGLLVSRYSSEINIVYKRFEENVGSYDLVEHWKRCVNLSNREEWIWLFSDDDLMDQNCVELFYKHIEKHNGHSLLHFNLKVINENNKLLYKSYKFETCYSTMDFFTKRLMNKIHSCAVEYIVKRSAYDQVNGFESFDLAWASDDATWLKLSILNGIHTIEGAYVRWRYSTVNISSQSDHKMSIRKVDATINYIVWANSFFRDNGIVDVSTDLQKASYPIRVMAYSKSFSTKEKIMYINQIATRLKMSHIKFKMVMLWLYIECKEKMKELIAKIRTFSAYKLVYISGT